MTEAGTARVEEGHTAGVGAGNSGAAAIAGARIGDVQGEDSRAGGGSSRRGVDAQATVAVLAGGGRCDIPVAGAC